jgi:hypothetical protein
MHPVGVILRDKIRNHDVGGIVQDDDDDDDDLYCGRSDILEVN